MRRPLGTPPPVLPVKNPKCITQVRTYKLITPLFGGGVSPAEADPVTIIRGSSIRGQLRFWWRATRGGNPKFGGKLETMRDLEGELWGAASTADKLLPSQVQITIKVTKQGQEFVVRDRQGQKIPITHSRSPYSYAAFPLQDKPQPKVVEGIEFTLTIEYPACYQDEVAAALWAWETFGGIGGRTRRGFGALLLQTVDGQPYHPPTADHMESSLRTQMKEHVSKGEWPRHVPHLIAQGNPLKVTPSYQDGLAAWAELLSCLKRFRQSRPTGQQNRPGRSNWPEPDEIRRLTGQSLPRHANANSQIPKFPRAVFGLPIVFHFKDNHPNGQSTAPHQDPRDTFLEPQTYQRRASPLILRPLLCAENQAVGVALLLRPSSLPPGELLLKRAPRDPSVDARLTRAEAATIQPLGGEPNVLKAFLDTF